MKKALFLLCILSFLISTAQKKAVSLEDLNSLYTFSAKGIKKLKSMDDGEHYTSLVNSSVIEKYSFRTGEKISTLVDLSTLKDCPIKKISGYALNSDATFALIYTNKQYIYRRSFRANYFVVDIKRKEIKSLSENGKQMAAIFSPDGEMVSFVKDNNVFIYKIRFGTETQVTTDGEFNKIINGIPDWVYEEEFAFNNAMAWSPNGSELAFIRFDESNVKQFSFPIYKASYPTQSSFELYPGEYKFKYPKAGAENAIVDVKVYNIKNRTTKTMKIDGEDFYIPRIRYTKEEGKLGIFKLNRNQNQFDLLIGNTASTLTKSIFTHRNDYYISEDILDNLTFLDNGKNFVYVGELDGYNHIHLYSMAGLKIRQITKGEWDVTNFYGYDELKKVFYYQAAKASSTQREIYGTHINAKKTQKLSNDVGTNTAIFSKNYSYFINTFSNTTTPPKYTLHANSGKVLRTLESNVELSKKVKDYYISKKEFFSFTTPSGVSLNGWMVKPLNFDPNKKYPVLMTQYSGPNSQQVLDRWGIGWEQHLASKGYVVACVDPRGTGARGEEFRKCTYMKLGKLESDDQIEAAKYLGSLGFCDADRIAIWGWSYGGFMSCSCLSKGNNTFKVGIAVAPVTSWRYYDSVYTERFMRKPQENPKGYDDNSPIKMTENLTGRLFLIHGSADDNVHFQNTMEYVDQLIQSNKQFDMFVYPNRDHGIRGGNSRMHLYQMMTNYLGKNL